MSLTQTAEYPWRFQSDPTFVSGSLATAAITQFYHADIIDTDTGNVITHVSSDPSSLTVDLVAKSASTVTVGDNSYSYGEAVAVMQAILAQERAIQLTPPPPPSP